MSEPCPTPEKKWYATERVAKDRAVQRSLAFGHDMEPYECRCGSWHLRSVDKNRQTAARLATQSAQVGYWLRVAQERGFAPIQAVRLPLAVTAVPAGGHPRSFTPEEDALVLNTTLTKAQIAARLGRSPGAIKERRQRLAREVRVDA